MDFPPFLDKKTTTKTSKLDQLCDAAVRDENYWLLGIRDLPRPQCQPNQTYCTAGEALLILCAGLWARAQACHQNRKKKEITWSYGFEARLRAAMEIKQSMSRPSPQYRTQCQQTFPCCTVCLVWLALGAREIPYGRAAHKKCRLKYAHKF